MTDKDLADHLAALRAVRKQLERYNTGSPSETGEVVERIRGRPLYKAVQVLQAFYPGGSLPRPGITLWRRLLDASNADQDDGSADEACDALLAWVQRQIDTLAMAEPAETDGPGKVREFRFRGVVVTMPPQPWHLVKFLWGCRNREAELFAVAAGAWKMQPDELSDNAIAAAATRASRAFAEVAVPVAIRVKAGMVSLVIEG